MNKEMECLNNEDIPESLKLSDAYIYRHLGNSGVSTQKMLDKLGCSTIDELMDQVVPDAIAL